MNATEFRRYAIGAFRDLSLKYELHPLDTPAAPGDFTAHFHNSTTNIDVIGINYGFGVNVRVSSTNRRGMKFATYDLDDLLAIRANKSKTICPSDNDTNDIQKQQIDEYAMLLGEFAGDVLSGDFAIFPLLAQAIQTRIEQQEHERVVLRTHPRATTDKSKPWWRWW